VNARRTTPAAPAQPPPRQPTRDEAAALRAFERAHREFVRGRFADARALFRTLVEKHAGVSEVTARARTYLAIADARLRTESTLPRDADSLYGLGAIDSALESLQRALDLQPNLRVRAQHDQDLTVLRNDPDFERLVFAPRF
jgi:tetratricopeptide (TPR) repeat protein